jgi:glycolate oxidase FAD binding subunit
VTAAALRAATAGDAVLGVQPAVVYEPGTLPEASEVVGSATREGRRLVFVGGATELDLGAAPHALDAILRTSRLARILDYAPSDQVVTAEAGVTLATLQEALAQNGQRLALDPPQAARATLGGIVAANTFGPRRARFGSVRDLIIGIRIVRADGVVAKGGGKVVKTVAGFDLPKLMVGSLGTLGLIADVTFRLHPLPEESVTLVVPDRKASEVWDLVGKMREAQLEPVSVVALWRPGGAFETAVRFEGFGAGVKEQSAKLQALVAAELRCACDALTAAAAGSFWERHDQLRVGSPVSAKLAALPGQLQAIVSDVLPALTDGLEDPGFAWYATLGLGFVSGRAVATDPEKSAGAVSSARATLERLGGSLTLRSAPPFVRERVPVWGTPPPALALMKSVKQRLDPGRCLAPGRFVGGI